MVTIKEQLEAKQPPKIKQGTISEQLQPRQTIAKRKRQEELDRIKRKRKEEARKIDKVLEKASSISQVKEALQNVPNEIKKYVKNTPEKFKKKIQGYKSKIQKRIEKAKKQEERRFELVRKYSKGDYSQSRVDGAEASRIYYNELQRELKNEMKRYDKGQLIDPQEIINVAKARANAEEARKVRKYKGLRKVKKKRKELQELEEEDPVAFLQKKFEAREKVAKKLQEQGVSRDVAYRTGIELQEETLGLKPVGREFKSMREAVEFSQEKVSTVDLFGTPRKAFYDPLKGEIVKQSMAEDIAKEKGYLPVKHLGTTKTGGDIVRREEGFLTDRQKTVKSFYESVQQQSFQEPTTIVVGDKRKDFGAEDFKQMVQPTALGLAQQTAPFSPERLIELEEARGEELIDEEAFRQREKAKELRKKPIVGTYLKAEEYTSKRLRERMTATARSISSFTGIGEGKDIPMITGREEYYAPFEKSMLTRPITTIGAIGFSAAIFYPALGGVISTEVKAGEKIYEPVAKTFREGAPSLIPSPTEKAKSLFGLPGKSQVRGEIFATALETASYIEPESPEELALDTVIGKFMTIPKIPGLSKGNLKRLKGVGTGVFGGTQLYQAVTDEDLTQVQRSGKLVTGFGALAFSGSTAVEGLGKLKTRASSDFIETKTDPQLGLEKAKGFETPEGKVDIEFVPGRQEKFGGRIMPLTNLGEDIPLRQEYKLPSISKSQLKVLGEVKGRGIITGSYAQKALVGGRSPADIDVLSAKPGKLATDIGKIKGLEIKPSTRSFQVFETKTGRQIADIVDIKIGEEGFARIVPTEKYKGFELLKPQARLQAKSIQQARKLPTYKRLKIAQDIATLRGEPELATSPSLLRGYGLSKKQQAELVGEGKFFAAHGGFLDVRGESLTLREGRFFYTPSAEGQKTVFARKSRMGLADDVERVTPLELLFEKEKRKGLQFFPKRKAVLIEELSLKQKDIVQPFKGTSEIEVAREVVGDVDINIVSRGKTIVEGKRVDIAFGKLAKESRTKLRSQLEGMSKAQRQELFKGVGRRRTKPKQLQLDFIKVRKDKRKTTREKGISFVSKSTRESLGISTKGFTTPFKSRKVESTLKPLRTTRKRTRPKKAEVSLVPKRTRTQVSSITKPTRVRIPYKPTKVRRPTRPRVPISKPTERALLKPFGKKKKKSKRKKKFKPIAQPQRYTPSLTAAALGITGKRPKPIGGKFKFGYRPSIRPLSKKKKRKSLFSGLFGSSKKKKKKKGLFNLGI